MEKRGAAGRACPTPSPKHRALAHRFILRPMTSDRRKRMHRTGIAGACFCALILALDTSAPAEEMPLARQDFASDPEAYTRNDQIFVESCRPPREAVAPAGDLEWGRLHAGKRVVHFCAVLERGIPERLHFDRDGDLDLAEEPALQPLDDGGYERFFDVPDVEGLFPGPRGLVKAAFSLFIDANRIPKKRRRFPPTGFNVRTYYRGAWEAPSGAVPVRWTPGNAPHFVVPASLDQLYAFAHSYQTDGTRVFVGGRALELAPACRGAGGRILAIVDAVSRPDTTFRRAPEGLRYLIAENAEDECAMFLPEDDRVGLLPGFHRGWMVFDRRANDTLFELSVRWTEKTGEEAGELGDPGSVSLLLRRHIAGREVRWSPTIADAHGRPSTLWRNGRRIAPHMVLREAGGEEILRHRFEFS